MAMARVRVIKNELKILIVATRHNFPVPLSLLIYGQMRALNLTTNALPEIKSANPALFFARN
jgi:uncharacterized protein YejL (UPF0352 family)